MPGIPAPADRDALPPTLEPPASGGMLPTSPDNSSGPTPTLSSAALQPPPVPETVFPSCPSVDPPVSHGVAPPGYVIEGELGRGGMGVVYKARQVKADRVVALKMILAGGHAGSAARDRFRTEAEAVARLQHPHIVQVFEVGECDGLPFFSLEFCSGGSLDRKLAGTPLPPQESAALVETLARAIDAAHKTNIIHRDLKPANVLLDAAGLPKVTDFGLAKKVDEAGQTASVAIMGTPSYMAPEQAGGRSKQVGPAADIYALGAILYECLTGRPPFKGVTLADTLTQVLHDEPIPPLRLNPHVPRDLEVICLKCLHKEPSRRYRSAADLAEELRRFRAGEPIQARSVGRLERGWRWCRRNPAVSALFAAVALALTVGTAVSTYFAIDASGQAEQAKNKEAAAVAARRELEKANSKLRDKQDDLERTLARSLLRPLGLGAKPWEKAPLTDPEVESLEELAESRSEDLGYRFVEESLRSARTIRQLRIRAEAALHAAVGLNLEKRARVERLLIQRLHDRGLGAEEQTDIALIVVALGNPAPNTAVRSAEALVQAIAATADKDTLCVLAQGLAVDAPWMEPASTTKAVDALAKAMSTTTDRVTLRQLVRGVSAVAARMDSSTAAQAAAYLARVMASKKTRKDISTLDELSPCLRAITVRMEPSQAATFLTKVLAETTDNFKSAKVGEEARYVLSQLAGCLSAVAARMEPTQAFGVLAQAMTKTTERGALRELTEGLSTVSARMEPVHAAKDLAQVWEVTTDSYALAGVAECVAAVAARMQSAQGTRMCAEIADALVQAIAGEKDNYAREALSKGLSKVAARLASDQAARVCDEVVDVFVQAMTGATREFDRSGLARGLSAVAAHMKPATAAKAAEALAKGLVKSSYYTAEELAHGLLTVTARMEPGQGAEVLVQAMTETTDRDVLRVLVEGLSAVAARMEPAATAKPADDLLQAMTRTKDSHVLRALGAGLSAVATRMEPGNRAKVADELLQVITDKKTDKETLPRLAEGLSVIAARMEPRHARRVCEQAGKALVQVMAEPSNEHKWYLLQPLAESLSAIARRIEPDRAAHLCGEAAHVLIQAMPRTKDHAQGELAKGLSMIVPWLKPSQAARHCSEAAGYLVLALDRILAEVPANPSQSRDFTYAKMGLAEGFSAVAPLMEPSDAAKAGHALTQLMSKRTHIDDWVTLAQFLSIVAVRMEPKDAAKAADTIAQVMSKTADSDDNPNDKRYREKLNSLAQGVPAVAARMVPIQAMDVLAKTMIRTTDNETLDALAQGLSATAARMEPSQAAASLAQAMTETADDHALLLFVKTLSAVAARMEPAQAARVCAQAADFLTQRMAKTTTTDLEYRPAMANALSAVLLHNRPAENSARCTAIASVIGSLGGRDYQLATPVEFAPALEPVPCRFSTPELVELLKQPLCIGPAGSVILDQLEHRYHRKFATHWEFIRYAEEQKLGLDFTTPPKR